MLYLPINKAWIISRTARRLYLVCAILALSLVGVYLATQFALAMSGFSSFEGLAAAAMVVQVLLWPGIVGTALLSIAMWYFWFNFDNSGWLRKAIWFLPLYFLLGIGPALYYFLVYRRHAAVTRC